MTGESTFPTETVGTTYRLLDGMTLELDAAAAVEMSLDELDAAISDVLGLSGSFAMCLGPGRRAVSHSSANSMFRIPPSVGFYNKYSGFGPPPPACFVLQTNPFPTFLSPRFDFEVGG